MKMQKSLQDELESRERSGNHFPDPVLLSLFLRICQVSMSFDIPTMVLTAKVDFKLCQKNVSRKPLQSHNVFAGCQGTPQIFSTFGSQVSLSLYLLKVQAPEQVKQLQLRDIKPHNVLLTKDYSPVLMDFGSAAPARITPANLKEAAYLQARGHYPL